MPESKNGTKPDQSERFKQTARELDVELDEDKLKDALRRMGKADQEGKSDPSRKRGEKE